jgi:hypothetical protein
MRTGISMISTPKASILNCRRGKAPQVLASSASLHNGSPDSPRERFQHAWTLYWMAPDKLDSHRLSLIGHSRGREHILYRAPASTFLHLFAPRALPRFVATTGALTPAQMAQGQPYSGQVSLLHTTRPSMHSVSKHLTRPVTASLLPAQRDRLLKNRSDGFALSIPESGLHLESAGSSLRTAESSFLSYGLHVCLWLLPTPPHGDAVTFDYRERASPGGGLAPPRSRLLAGARIPACAGRTL